MKRLVIGMGTCGKSVGAGKVLEKARELLSRNKSLVELDTTGCIGMCYNEPLVFVEGEDHQRTVYARVTPEVLETIFEEHLLGDNVVISHRIMDQQANLAKAFFPKQKRIAIRNIGKLNPESFEDYENREGFRALQKVLESSKNAILSVLQSCGFENLGKYENSAVDNIPKKKTVIICNADCWENSAFIDRSLLEGNPFLIIEGMLIAGYALGADEGYISVSSEFPYAIEFLQNAIEILKENRVLGKNIFGSDFSFDLHIREGVGEFIGIGDTFLASRVEKSDSFVEVENFAFANFGLTNTLVEIGTTEIFAKIPWIILNGAEECKQNQTKVLVISGKINRSGLIEAPIGATFREIIFDIGGGMKDDGMFKAALVGGLSGFCISEEQLDFPIDCESIAQIGFAADFSNIVVMDESSCMVDVARHSLLFALRESCGKCLSCRIGVRKLFDILERIVAGKGRSEDLDTLREIAEDIKKSACCVVGKSAADTVLSTLEFFKAEYIEHIEGKKCRAEVCKFGVTEVV